MPTTEGLNEQRVSELVKHILEPVRANYLAGPTSPDRAYEALNALSSAAAIVIAGCDGMGGQAEKFFYQALTINLKNYCGRGEPGRDNEHDVRGETDPG